MCTYVYLHYNLYSKYCKHTYICIQIPKIVERVELQGKCNSKNQFSGNITKHNLRRSRANQIPINQTSTRDTITQIRVKFARIIL